MSVRELSPALVDHLVDEFGVDGERAIDFFGSARVLLAGEVDLPQGAAHAAYAMREGLLALLRSADVPDVPPWRDASRAVVAAKDAYLAARGLQGAGADAALLTLLDRIDEMATTHDRAGLHQQRLIAIMLQRTGAAPLDAGLRPVKRFDDLLGGVNTRLHGEAALDETRALWDEVVGLLEQLFLPPKARHDELEQLAQRTDVGEAELQRALELLATPEHLQYFLARIKVATWLEELADRGLIEPTSGAGPWPGFRAVEALRATHPDEVLAVLEKLATRHHRDAAASWTLARAAHDLGLIGGNLVLQLAAKHPASPALIVLAIDAATDADPGDELVERVSDIALNYDLLSSRAHLLEKLLTALIDGITPDNVAGRVRLLCHKLRHVPAEDLDLRMLLYSNASVAVPTDTRTDEPVPLLLGALTAAFTSASSLVPIDELLDALDKLPKGLRARVRPWLLSASPSVPREDVVQELIAAVAQREATADDVALFAKLVEMGSVADCVQPWSDALGQPPEIGEVAAGLREHTLDPRWLRARTWSAVLPEEAWDSWRPALTVLRSAFGPPEARFEPSMNFEVGFGRSPYSVEELQALSVAAAAEQIANWRPEPGEMLVSARELGRALEAAVAADPQAWTERALETAALLHHPTYLAHYMRGLARSKQLKEINLAQVLEVIELIAAHPWPVRPLGRDNAFDYDPDWSAADDAVVAVLRALAEAQVALGEGTPRAWDLVLAASRCEPTTEGEVEDTTDTLSGAMGRAINRSCTKALEALVYLAGQAYRETGAVPSGALDEFVRVLGLPNEDGLQHRAILAPRIAFLRRVAPEWTEAHLDLMFGSAAPAGLGDETLALTLRWSRAPEWFSERFAEKILSFAVAGREQALEQALVAYLWGVPGYELANLIRRLEAAQLLSASGEQLGRLLRAADVPPEYVERGRSFWEAALLTGSVDLGGFGWLADVEVLDDESWLDLTLRSVEQCGRQLDWAHAVAERAVRSAPSEAVLGLLNALVRRLTDPWERRSIGEQAVQALKEAGDLAATPAGRRLDTTLRERGFLT